jgi:hypothetical protein
MSVQLITTDVWPILTKAARQTKRPAHVAVAYFGKGAADLLSLPAKSRLVVDVSEAAVRNGQTHPADLRRMQRRQVAIYSVRNLHAKVFAFDKSVFIGSANASKHSAEVLQEAVIRVSDAAMIRATRGFVEGLCLEPLGPKELERLQKLYRPPRFVPGQNKKSGPKPQFSALRIAPTTAHNISDKLAKAFETERKEARKKRRHHRGFDIEEIYWSVPCPLRKGQLIIQVHKNAYGRTVSPPGHIIHTSSYREGKIRKTLLFVELPKYEWEPLSRFGKEEKKILSRGGIKSQSTTKKLLAFWRHRAI